MTIETLKKFKVVNDKNRDTTYLIRRNSDDGWYADELCMLRDIDVFNFKLFRPMDGKVYTLNEGDLNSFIVVGVII